MQRQVKRLSRCMPVGDLPYDTDKAATKMMVKLFEDIPYLANMPVASENESIINRTLMNLPGIIIKGKKIFFKKDAPNIKSDLVYLDTTFNKSDTRNIDMFQFDSFFLFKYFQIIERIKPAETVINFMGPFSAALNICNQDNSLFLSDKFYRKFIIQAICARACWIIGRINEISPETRPIIMLEEPFLYKIGDVIRGDDDITKDIIVNLFSKITAKLQTTGALVGIQCFEKCDWKIPIEAGVNIISFDAYNNPNNLNIIAECVNEFLAKGGRINWGIVPVKNETMVKELSVDYIFDRLVKTFEGLIVAGASERLVYNHATVSIQGNINNLPIIFAEKALIIATQVAKRIPVKS